jgi:hypothetical protein
LTESQRRKTTDNEVSDAQEVERQTADDSLRSQAEHENDETATNTPRSQAFGTTEILEAILEHLPGRTLFGVQRVSKHFQATIIGSQRIQHKMFLRISNKTETLWARRWDEISEPEFEQVPQPESDRNEMGVRRRLMIPVHTNPSFKLEFKRRGIIRMQADKKENSKLSRRRPFTKPELEQLSITKGFLSDPHCTTVVVDLSFTLGVRLPTRITLTSIVKSSTPLPIDAVVAKALDEDIYICIEWRGDGHISLPTVIETGVARQVLDRLTRQTGLELFFRFSDFSFVLDGAIAPTDEERAAVASFSGAQT